MKKIRKIAFLLAVICCVASVPCFGPLKVSAEGSKTYTLKYMEDRGEWRFQANYPWDEKGTPREMYYFYQEIKDGDTVVVTASPASLDLKIDKKLSNLTIENTYTLAIVSAPEIEECYVLKNSIAAINGNVKNAYVYDNARCTFNDNVEELQIIETSSLMKANVTMGGTVGKASLQDENNRTLFKYYSFAPASFVVEDGNLKTPASKYSMKDESEAPAPSLKEQKKELASVMVNGRLPESVYKYEYYKSTYSDLQKAFGDDEESYLNHFIQFGLKEGRSGSETFNAEAYRNRYSDLNATFGNDWAAYVVHYINFGIAEKRNAAP